MPRPSSFRTPRAAALCVSSASLLAITVAAPGDELAKLLRRPPSPGSVALLAVHAGEAGVAGKLKEALSSPDAETRGAAARVVNLKSLLDLHPSVEQALAAENDPIAAKEQIRVLAAGGKPHEPVILEAARRLSPRLDRDLVGVLARARGPDAIPLYFSELRRLALAPSDREAFFRLATRGRPDLVIAAAALALGRLDADDWQAILNVAGPSSALGEQPLLSAALRSNQPVFRGEAAWYLARSYCGQQPPAAAAELLAALEESQPAVAPETPPELRFGAEILRRVLGRPAVEDAAWIACLESNTTCHLDSDVDESPLIDYLTPREREAIVRRNEAHRPAELRSGGKKTGPTPGKVLLRLVSGLPNGVARDLFDIEGCRSRPDMRWVGIASIAFRPDGVPRLVTITSVPPGDSCHRTAEVLFTMSLAPDTDPDPSGEDRTYLALFDVNEVACPETPAAGSAPAGPVRVRAKVLAPKLVKRVEPAYPAASRRNGEHGVSVYEAVISPTGCIRELRLLRSASPTLDIMGMEAISRWIYTPATLDGRPVSVYLTVTVTFQLTGRPNR